MKTAKFIHLVRGQPARFNGEQLVITERKIRPAGSLQQIKREQRASSTWRKGRGWDCGTRLYGYRELRSA